MRFKFRLGDLVEYRGERYEVVERRLIQTKTIGDKTYPAQWVYLVGGAFRRESDLTSKTPCPKCGEEGYNRLNGCLQCRKKARAKKQSTEDEKGKNLVKQKKAPPCISYKVDPNLIGCVPIEELPKTAIKEFTVDYNELHRQPSARYSSYNRKRHDVFYNTKKDL